MPNLTDSFERQHEEAIARASDAIYATAPDTDKSTNTSTPDPSSAGRMATDVDNNEKRAPTQEGERTMSQDWDYSGRSKIEDVEDSSLVEYTMGRDIHIHIDKSKSKRKVMVTYQVNRRGQMQAVVKMIETAGKDLGDEYKIGVSGGQHSIRGAIKGNYAEAHTLKQLDKAAGINEVGKAH